MIGDSYSFIKDTTLQASYEPRKPASYLEFDPPPT